MDSTLNSNGYGWMDAYITSNFVWCCQLFHLDLFRNTSNPGQFHPILDNMVCMQDFPDNSPCICNILDNFIMHTTSSMSSCTHHIHKNFMMYVISATISSCTSHSQQFPLAHITSSTILFCKSFPWLWFTGARLDAQTCTFTHPIWMTNMARKYSFISPILPASCRYYPCDTIMLINSSMVRLWVAMIMTQEL